MTRNVNEAANVINVNFDWLRCFHSRSTGVLDGPVLFVKAAIS